MSDDVLTYTEGRAGRIRLNRPKAIHALNRAMVDGMTEALLRDGDVSQLEALRARRQVTELEARVAAARNKYRQDASAEAAKIEAEIAALRDASSPYPGESAARIVEIVAADHSELVDPATVTEVPWERQPGREPLDD